VVLTPPYFNIAEKRKVTVNATCGEGVAQKEVYCKLVGYDSRHDAGRITYDILDGQVLTLYYRHGPSEARGPHAALQLIFAARQPFCHL